jgi:hypothetical protein
MTEALTIIASALVGGGAVYLWMRGKALRDDHAISGLSSRVQALERQERRLLAERDALQSEIIRLTDRDERGRFVRKEPRP